VNMDNVKIRRILVPTDFSDAAGEAVQAAIVMARAFDAGIEILHVTAAIMFLRRRQKRALLVPDARSVEKGEGQTG